MRSQVRQGARGARSETGGLAVRPGKTIDERSLSARDAPRSRLFARPARGSGEEENAEGARSVLEGTRRPSELERRGLLQRLAEMAGPRRPPGRELSEEGPLDRLRAVAEERALPLAAGCLAAGAAAGALAASWAVQPSRPASQIRPAGVVTSVSSKVSAYESMESIRENTLVALKRELASGGAQGEAALAGAAASADLARAAVESLDPLLREVVAGGDCADTQVARLSPAASQLVRDPSSGEVLCSFSGGSPAGDLGEAVAQAGSCTAALLWCEGGVRCYLALVPLCDEGGDLHCALYVAGLTSAGRVAHLAYAGLACDGVAEAVSERLRVAGEEAAGLDGADAAAGGSRVAQAAAGRQVV